LLTAKNVRGTSLKGSRKDVGSGGRESVEMGRLSRSEILDAKGDRAQRRVR